MSTETVIVIGYTAFLIVAAITIAIVDLKDMNRHAKQMREIRRQLDEIYKEGADYDRAARD
ncbi:MAG: hypothetical protein Q4D87_08860 [Actinomycetaceae bacterium]|nr:hypothetical protein [Actinomycetaceae bacterium]